MLQERQFDDPEVGSSGQQRFQVTLLPQRVALVPRWQPKSALQPSPELRERSDQGDPEAVEAVIRLERTRELRENGARPKSRRPPTVLDHEIDGEPGYLYISTFGMRSHFFDQRGRFRCKTDEWRIERKIGPGDYAPCCEFADPINPTKGDELTVVPLLVYVTDERGEVTEVPLSQQRPMEGGKRLNFRFRLRVWGLSDGQVRAWKQTQVNHPPISFDYEIVKSGPQKFDRIRYDSCAESLWRQLGPGMVKYLLHEAQAQDLDGMILREFGRDFETPEDQYLQLGGAPQPVQTPRSLPGGVKGFLTQ